MAATIKFLVRSAVLSTMTAFAWPASAASTCTDLVNLAIPQTEITLAEPVAAGAFSAPDGNEYDLPAFCRVHGVAKPSGDSQIQFEVWLPEDWNGRYYQVGTGGFAGRIFYGSLADNLKQGNAVAGTDTGHRGEGWDASWALGHPQKLVDYGYRSLKETTNAAKAAIGVYYGRAAKHRYFAGCSNGGREAMMVAQRYPEDWDGILVGAPARFLTYTEIVKAWNEVAQWGEPGGNIPLAKLPAIQKAALAACRPEAHVVEDIAADPRFCRFDPDSLRCEKGEDNNTCLTAQQADTLKRLYSGPKSIFPGLEPTFEASESWQRLVIGEQPRESILYKLGNGFFANMVFDDPAFTVYDLDFDAVTSVINNKVIANQTLRDILNASNSDLSTLQQQGGKILMYYGWGDVFLPPQGEIDYYHRVIENTGGLEKTQDYFRLFMVPGMGHCGGGPGANAFGQYSRSPALKEDAAHNVQKALEAWVEQGKAPKTIIATKYVDDKPEKGVAFTRPLCPYPQVPKYTGLGSTDLAVNFECVDGMEP